ncbi:MAG: AMP-dependent synthetase, partial [Boseongicola sp. SB0664_bin_43]|nr:AMP-dependent synthetase [Boseongicola sp. SB0664_bin_43]
AVPGVRDVAAIGLPDAKWGERVHAIVALDHGARASEAELIEGCADRIARFKRPRGVTFVRDADIPRTATGKIQHGLLKEKFQSGALQERQMAGMDE